MPLGLLGPEAGARLWGEALVWSLPAIGALARFVRAPRGGRLGWLVIAAACAVVVLDKAIDVQTVLHHAGQDLVRAVDPEHRMRGPNAWMRWLLLGGGFLLATGLMVWVAVRDRDLTGGKRLSLVGLVMVLGYLGARLLPAVKARVEGGAGLAVEAVCWVVIVAGIARGPGGEA